MDILFYILVPVYKTEEYIDACIESVLKQTYDNWRLILVDDGSPDQCGSICDGYSKKNQNIHVIHQKNAGSFAARQAALQYVRQQDDINEQKTYILYLDSDDTFKPEALQVIRDSIMASKCDLLVYCMDRVADGKILSSFNVKCSFTGEITDKRDLYNLVLRDDVYNPLWRKAVQLSLYSTTDYSEYYHIALGEDLLQSLDFYRNCNKAVFIKDSLYNYTLNSSSITQDVNFKNYELDSTVRKKVWEFINTEAVMADSDIQIYLRCRRIKLSRIIRNASVFCVGYMEKKKSLDKICNDAYYSILLEGASADQILVWLLKHRQYHMVIWISYLISYAGKATRPIRKYFRGKSVRCEQKRHC